MNTFIDPNMLLSQASTQRNRPTGGNHDPQTLKKTAQEFESLLIHSMLKSMRAATPDGGLLPKGVDRETFESLMDMEVARQAAFQNDSELSEAIVRQLGPKEDASQ